MSMQLCALVAPDHLSRMEHPAILVWQTPSQLPSQCISEYFYQYLNFLALSAFIDNNATTLNNKIELDKFIAGTNHMAWLNQMSRQERLSIDPVTQQRYIQGQIVLTNTNNHFM